MATVGHDLDHIVMQFAFFVSVMVAEQWLMWSYTLPGTGLKLFTSDIQRNSCKESLLGVA